MCSTVRFVILFLILRSCCQKVKGGNGPRTISLSLLDIEAIVTKHNQLRASVSSSDMRYMTWDSELSVISQNYGRKCQFSHNTKGHHSLFKNSIGENIYVATGIASYFDSSHAIQLWFDEKSDFSYASRTCKEGKKCGHYTQVVWASTYKVGCSLTMCDDVTGFQKNSHLFICNYSPAGNIYTQQEDGSHVMKVPFLKGTYCSQCKSPSDQCKEKLCASSLRDQDISYVATQDQKNKSNSCDGLIVAVVLLSFALFALLCYTIYRQRVTLSLKYQNWENQAKSNHAKFSNQNTPQPSRSNTPRPSIVGSTLHGTTRAYHDNKSNLLTPAPTSKINDSEKGKYQEKDFRLAFETASHRPSNSTNRPVRPPPPHIIQK